MKTTVISILGIINNDVVKEADRLIADELEELNKHSKYCYTATEVAKPYGMKGNDLLSFLKDRKVVIKRGGDHRLTRRYQNQDLEAYRYSIVYNQQGKMRVKPSLVWTEKGREFLKEIIEH